MTAVVYSIEHAALDLRQYKLGAAQIIVPVSMAKITGSQNPLATANVFTRVFLPYAPHPTVDPYVILTEGLYAHNADLSAAEWRRHLDTSLDFLRKFRRNIDDAAKTEPLILPDVYQTHSWDETIYKAQSFTHHRGLLRHAYHDNRLGFRAVVHNDILRRNPTPIKNLSKKTLDAAVAFIIEEHALSYAFNLGSVHFDRLLTKDKPLQQIIMAYNGQIPASQIISYRILHGKNPVEHSKWLYADTSQRPMKIYDVGLLLSAQNG